MHYMGNLWSEAPLEPACLKSNAFDAIAGGRLDKLQQYAIENPKLCDNRKDGKSLLHWAVLHGQASCVEFLLHNGMDSNITDIWGNTPLMELAHCKSKNTAEVKSVFELLIKSKANINAFECHKRTVLLRTLIHFKHQVSDMLLDFGADVNLGDVDGLRPIHVCSIYSNLPLLRKVIHKKADIDAQDSKKRTALYCAIHAGHKEIADELLRQGANINLSSVYGCPLQTALIKHKYDSVLTLLQHGACINFMVEEDRYPFSKASDCLNLALIILHVEISTLQSALQTKTIEDIVLHGQLLGAARMLDLIVQANGENVSLVKNVFFLNYDASFIFRQGDYPLFIQLKRICRQLQFLHDMGKSQTPIPRDQIPRAVSLEDTMSLQNLCRMNVRKLLTGMRSNVLFAVKQLDCTAVVKDILLLKDIM